MNTNEVANRLVELCRKGEYENAYKELYSNEIESAEAPQAGVPIAKGIEQVLAKTKQWQDSVQEMHSAAVSEPLVTGNHFTVTMENDVTFKDRGRTWMKEIAVYEVNNGKIVKENFFYNM